MRAADPAALGAWYRDCLGLDADENGLWQPEAGVTVFATFESETEYFGSRAQQTMLNFRVRDLDAMLAQCAPRERTWTRRLRRWRVSAGSAGSPILKAIGSSCGSLADSKAAGRGGEGRYQRLEPGGLITDAGHGDRQAGLGRAVRAADEHAHGDEAAF